MLPSALLLCLKCQRQLYAKMLNLSCAHVQAVCFDVDSTLCAPLTSL